MKKKKILASVLIFLLVSMIALVVSTFAWFIIPGEYTPGFDAQVVKSYFDNSTGTNDGLSATAPFIITKPVHLYNLSYLQNKGIFKDHTYYFQLGKKKSMIDSTSTDTTYYVYSSNISDETSNADLTSVEMDMTQYNNGVIQPIGYKSVSSEVTDYVFDNVFAGNGITISNMTVNAPDTMNYIGMFGYIGDGASIKNFNLNNLTVKSSSSASSTTDTMGLVVGYMNGTTSTSIKIEGIGVKDSTIQGGRKATSKFSIIGGGSDVSMAALDGGYNISGDTGVMYGDEMFNQLAAGTAAFQNNFTTVSSGGSVYVAYNKEKAWVGSNKSTFGIFTLGTNIAANKAAFGSYFSTNQVSYFDFSTEFDSEFKTPTLDVTDGTYTAAKISGSFSGSSNKMTSVTLGLGSDIANKFVDSSNVPIQSVNYSLAFPGKAQYNLAMPGIDYANNNNTATVYQNALLFTITKSSGGYINFICSVPSDKTTSDRNIGLWKLDPNGTTTVNGSFYDNVPNYFYLK